MHKIQVPKKAKKVIPHNFILRPYKDWVPTGHHNFVFPVMYIDGKSNVPLDKADKIPIGDFEVGTDGFIQAIFVVDGKMFKIRRYPKNEYVDIIVWDMTKGR